MAKVSFASLRDEALSRYELEPFVLEMPGKQKDITIQSVPTGLFLTTFYMEDVNPTVGRAWKFMEAVTPAKDWPRLSEMLREQPMPVLSDLVDAITEHFNLVFESTDAPKESDDSDK
ncbi:hypothetical protein [Corynebacterium guaraldiae]|uniref:hypothetical protein n=1 Tax=Corynebacterium guaraldiae TaxID=3051103 RepID=UPI0011871D6E|nr:hypothetical protein [Corynebacterium guaraldiae]MCG7261159.1 hypothetical protein [Corynebacterium aurimucosum]TRX51525.1 hypothetical protein FNY91_09415 [Corynebacterium guaraldiae]